MPKTIAPMSMTNVLTSSLARRRKRRPSSTDARPTGVPPPSTGNGWMKVAAMKTAANETASTRKTVPAPKPARRSPANVGPIDEPEAVEHLIERVRLRQLVHAESGEGEKRLGPGSRPRRVPRSGRQAEEREQRRAADSVEGEADAATGPAGPT